MPRRALFYRIALPIGKLATSSHPNGRVEILGKGQQIVTHGEHPLIGQPYTWPKSDILSANLTDLPLVTSAQLYQLHRVLETFLSPSSPPSMMTPAANQNIPLASASSSGPILTQPANQNTPGFLAPATISKPSLVPIGARNIWLHRRACEDARFCPTVTALRGRLDAYNQAFTSPLPLAEVESIARSVWKYKSLGRLFTKGQQVVVLPIDKNLAMTLVKTHALSLYGVLKATRFGTFGISQKGTASKMHCGKKAIKLAIDTLIREGLIIEVARLPDRGGRKGARQYRFRR